MYRNLILISFFILFASQPAFARTVTDMRGKEIEIPDNLSRVATIDDGFVEGVMTHLGVIDSVIAIGSWSMKLDFSYTYQGNQINEQNSQNQVSSKNPENKTGTESYTYTGLNTMKYLHPWLDDLTCVNSRQGNNISFEALAAVNPEVVILRVGDCTVGGASQETVTKTTQIIEALGIPLVVLYSPNAHPDPNKRGQLASMREEGAIIGAIFGQEAQAIELMDYLASIETLIIERTQNIPEQDKTHVLSFGLDGKARSAGSAGSINGINTSDSYLIEEIVHANNVYQSSGRLVPVSAEHLYAMDPDVIILPTANGYHPPRELFEAPYYKNLQELRAVQEKQVYALPWQPMNCDRRVEYPLELLIVAKAAYPHLFADINVYDFALDFYKKVYHVDDETAQGLRSTQILGWMDDINF